MRLNNRPLLVLKLLIFTSCVFSYPRLALEEWYKNARDVVVLHHLMNDRHRKCFHLIRDETNDAKAAHRCFKFYVSKLLLHFLLLCLIHELLCTNTFVVRHDILSISKLLTFAHHHRELSVAVVN